MYELFFLPVSRDVNLFEIINFLFVVLKCGMNIGLQQTNTKLIWFEVSPPIKNKCFGSMGPDSVRFKKFKFVEFTNCLKFEI